MRFSGRPAAFGRERSRATAVLFTTALVVGGLAVIAVGALGAPPAAGRTVTVTVSANGDPAQDRTFQLTCDPVRGDRPASCARLEELARSGWADVFDPVPADAVCTMIYGGPATARVSGRWDGRPVDSRFARSDGCEIARWDALRPVLPDSGP